jgi:hypothetical protein
MAAAEIATRDFLDIACLLSLRLSEVSIWPIAAGPGAGAAGHSEPVVGGAA